jgi:Amidohydrolase family
LSPAALVYAFAFTAADQSGADEEPTFWRFEMTFIRPRLTAVLLSAVLLLVGPPAIYLLGQAPAGGTVALTGARLIDGTGRPPLEQATLLIRNGRVLGTGANDLPDAVALRDEQEQGTLNRARVYVAGPSLRDLKTADEARTRVDRYADVKADIIKIHITGGPNDTPPEVYAALIDQAHKRGLRVAAHMYYLKDARGLVNAGVDVLAHSVRDQDVDAELIASIKRRNVGYIPTFTRDLAVFTYETTPAFFNDPFFLRHADVYRREMTLLSDPAQQEKTRNNKDAQAIKPALQQGTRNLKLLADAGVEIALGTDSGTNLGQWQGYFEHTELEMMVKAGLTPMQALVAATGGAARVMKLDQHLGTLQPGKWADLVVLRANPLDDVRHTRQIDSIWIAGKRLSDVP